MKYTCSKAPKATALAFTSSAKYWPYIVFCLSNTVYWSLYLIGFSNYLVNPGQEGIRWPCAVSCLGVQHLQNTTRPSLKWPFATQNPSGWNMHLGNFELGGCSDCSSVTTGRSRSSSPAQNSTWTATNTTSKSCRAHQLCGRLSICTAQRGGWMSGLGCSQLKRFLYSACWVICKNWGLNPRI